MKKAAHIVWVAAILGAFAHAGGSAAPVTIESLKITGTTYTLVVVPTAAVKDDPYLQDAFEKHRVVNFGGFGSGFEPIDASKSCVVQSRALLLMEDDVMSFHNAI